jgi:hypothetical protein
MFWVVLDVSDTSGYVKRLINLEMEYNNRTFVAIAMIAITGIGQLVRTAN